MVVLSQQNAGEGVIMSRTRRIIVVSLTALGLAAGGAAPLMATAAPAVTASAPATHLWG
jgi:hypothetical protein